MSNKPVTIWCNNLFVEEFPGDDWEPPSIWICNYYEEIYSEEFPREIRRNKSVVFQGVLTPRNKEIAEKLVKLYNESMNVKNINITK